MYRGRENSERLLPMGRVLATQFHPRKVAAIDTAPKGRVKHDRSAAAVCQKQELGLAHVAFIRTDLEKRN